MIRRSSSRRSPAAPRSSGRKSVWTASTGSNTLTFVPFKSISLLQQFYTDAGLNITGMEDYRIDRIIGRISAHPAVVSTQQDSFTVGITVASQQLTAAQTEPFTNTQWERFPWMWWDNWFTSFPTGDVNQSNYSHDPCHMVDIRTRRVIRSKDDSLFLVANNGTAAQTWRFAWALRILVSHS